MTDLLTNVQAAEYLHVSPTTLDTWRCTDRVKIPWTRVGRKILYSRSALDGYLAENSGRRVPRTTTTVHQST